MWVFKQLGDTVNGQSTRKHNIFDLSDAKVWHSRGFTMTLAWRESQIARPLQSIRQIQIC